MTTQRKYHKLLAKHYDEISEDFLSQVIREHPDWNPNRIANVRYGRTVDMDQLQEIIRISGKKTKLPVIQPNI